MSIEHPDDYSGAPIGAGEPYAAPADCAGAQHATQSERARDEPWAAAGLPHFPHWLAEARAKDEAALRALLADAPPLPPSISEVVRQAYASGTPPVWPGLGFVHPARGWSDSGPV